MSQNQKNERYRPKSALECKCCGHIIYSKTEGEFTACGCFEKNGTRGIFIDETRWYVRTGGNSEKVIHHDYEQVKSRIQEYESEQRRAAQQSQSKKSKKAKGAGSN